MDVDVETDRKADRPPSRLTLPAPARLDDDRDDDDDDRVALASPPVRCAALILTAARWWMAADIVDLSLSLSRVKVGKKK